MNNDDFDVMELYMADRERAKKEWWVDYFGYVVVSRWNPAKMIWEVENVEYKD